MVRTVEDLTPYTDADWMHLYISVGETDTHWENYEYVINKTAPEADKAYVEKFTGNGYESTVVGQVSYHVNGNVMIICIPKTMLGIDAATLDFTIDFKWTDNTGVDEEGNIMLWYTNGDVAPVGRFNYRYTTTAPEAYVKTEKVYGWSLMDFTDKDVTDHFVEHILSSVSGGSAVLNEDGLVLTPDSTDTKVILSYGYSTVGISMDAYKYIAITYKTDSLSQLKVAPAGGKYPTPGSTRSQTMDLVTDGEYHTVVLDMTGNKESRYWCGGYVTKVGFLFPSVESGDSVTIRSIQFLKEPPVEE